MDAPASNLNYQPLGGRGPSSAGVLVRTVHRLYLAEDHLVQVANTGYTESYKRFFFKDIQALVMSESSRRRTINLVMLLFASGAALFTWVMGDSTSATVGYYLGGSFLVVFMVGFGINFGLGKTCICSVKTAVQTEILWSLNRQPVATKVFAELRQRVVDAQGALSSDLLTATAGVGVTASSVTKGPTVVRAQLPVRADDGRWHQYLFCSLLVAAGVLACDAVFTSLALTVGSFLISFVTMGLLVMALIRQRDADTSRGLRKIVWGVLGFALSLMVMTYICFISMVMEDPEGYRAQTEWVRDVAANSPQDSLVLTIAYGFAVVGNLVLGISGLVAVQAHRRRQLTIVREPAAS